MVVSLFGCGNSQEKQNEKALCAVLKSLQEGETTFDEVVPFSWDKLYTFAPYMPKEAIEKIIGFSSSEIEENMVNEGLTYLLFVKDKEVVCNFFGYPDNLGFSVLFGNIEDSLVITNGEQVKFVVTKEDYGPCLTMAK